MLFGEDAIRAWWNTEKSIGTNMAAVKMYWQEVREYDTQKRMQQDTAVII